MKYALISLLLILSSCATYQPGHKAQHKSGEVIDGLSIATKIDKSVSNKYFKFLNLTFGNKGPGWIRIKKMYLKAPEKSFTGKINIVMGQDLKTYSESLAYVRQIDAYNQAVFLELVSAAAIVGTVATSASGNADGAAIGLGVLATSLTIQELNRFSNNISSLELGNIFPQGHIYRPFSVPAGLYAKKWILIEMESGELPESLTFEIELLDGRKTEYIFPLKAKKPHQKWANQMKKKRK